MEKMYPYAVARIRAIESNLFTNLELEQMLNEEPERIISILQEHKYNTDLIDRPEDFEIVLKNETEKLYKTIKELVPEEDFTNIFICKNDFHNIKTILKGEITKKDYDKYLIDGGMIPTQVMKKAIIENKLDVLPDIIQNAIIQTENEYEKEEKSHIIDSILDKYTYLYMNKLAEESKIDFIINYVKQLCDIVNLRTFFRIKMVSKDFENFKIAFIENGNISIRMFKEAFESDEPVLVFKQVSDLVLLNKITNDITSLAKICDNCLMDYVKVAKFEALGVEPLVAYTYAKEIEIKNIRTILTGKINNIDANIIKERLRDSYV